MDVPSPQAGHGRRSCRSRSATRCREGTPDPDAGGPPRRDRRCRHPRRSRHAGTAPRARRRRPATPQAPPRRASLTRPARRGARARRRPRRLHRRLPRRRPRQEGGAGRALPAPRRRLPQRRLHPVEGAAARRQGDHRGRGDGRTTASASASRRSISTSCATGRTAWSAKLTGGLGGTGQAAQGARWCSGVGAVHRRRTRSRCETADGARRVSFDHAIIAAGSQPAQHPGLPPTTRALMDSTGALELADVPKRLLVIGGGIIGLEMATVYDALGAKVTVVELIDGLIPGADPRPRQAAAQAHREALRGDPAQDQGGRSSRREADGLRATFEGDERARAAGVRPRAGRGRPPPQRQGHRRARTPASQVNERGFIPVDKQHAHQRAAHLRHRRHRRPADAGAQGDARRQGRRRGDRRPQGARSTPRAIPSVAYTDPEVAWMGLTETEAKAQGIALREGGRSPGRPAAARSRIGRDEGITKLIFDKEHAAASSAPASSAPTPAS